MKREILSALYAPLETKSRVGVGNKTFAYVPIRDIVDRMNKVFEGNWSTEVLDVQQIEDNVVVRVKVSVRDPDSGQFYSHEGFASHTIARFTSGPNANKVIDIGNVFKSAMSKAIKVAVEKWGVGLYLSDASEDSDGYVPITPSAVNTTAVPVTPTASAFPNFPNMPTQQNKTTNNVVTATPPSPQPVPPSVGIGVNELPTYAKPAATSAPVPNVPSFDFPVSGVENKKDFATPVQKAAIEHIMSWSGLTFQILASKALQRTSELPENLDAVEYKDAVKMIQYGNDANK